MFWKRLSIAKKTFLAIALTSTLIVIVMALMIGLNMRAGFARYLVQAEINRFDELERALAEAHDPERPRWPELAGSPQTWRRFVGRNVRPPDRAGSLQDAQGSFPPSAPVESPPRRRDPLGLGSRVSLLDENRNLIVGSAQTGPQFAMRPIMPIAASETSKPLGWIGLSAPIGAPGPADAIFLSGQLRSLAFASIVALVLSALAAFLLARQFLTPVKALADGANTLAAGNFKSRIRNDRHDELGTLIDQYNALAESLEAAEEAERQWITDTSHELQTPLAVLRAEIEALQDGVRQPTPDVLFSLHGSVMRLSHLVGDLNTLARTREAGFSLTLADVDLEEIIADSVDHARPGIEQAGLSLKVIVNEPLPVECDRYRVQQLLDNLLENARRYTRAPGEIVLAAAQDTSSVSITIDDTAPCPPPDSIGHLFERFYRVEASRSRDHGGSGLGLAICLAIAEAHGGRFEAAASELGGLKVVAILPKRAMTQGKGRGHGSTAA